uniref:Uncharacterized protein n=1 Tax=Helianthus annuus TaxID=4232 RepID=A0A251VBJ8_HELAN
MWKYRGVTTARARRRFVSERFEEEAYDFSQEAPQSYYIKLLETRVLHFIF